MFTELGVCIVD